MLYYERTDGWVKAWSERHGQVLLVLLYLCLLLGVDCFMPKSGSLFPTDENYANFLRSLKDRIRQSQLRASLAVNQEMVLLYWQIGKEILTRQRQEGWGTKVIEQLAKDLKREFPDVKGFSSRNLKYMRAFAEAYPDEQIVQQLAAQIPWFHNCIFSFVGSQYPIIVEGQEYRIDLLFYHFKLRCFIVIDLKMVEFEPEFSGKMNFYVSAVNAMLSHPDDQPTIGIILCKSKNKTVAELALQGMTQPIGVSTHKIGSDMPESIKSLMPTVEQLEIELQTLEVNNPRSE